MDVLSTNLLSEYAYLLAPGGILYTITDVEDLHNWHVTKCEAHPCFTRLCEEELVCFVTLWSISLCTHTSFDRLWIHVYVQ